MVTLTVNTDGGADYTSLSAAEVALPSSSFTEPYTIMCAGTTADTTEAVFSAAPTDTNPLTIQGDGVYTMRPAGSARCILFGTSFGGPAFVNKIHFRAEPVSVSGNGLIRPERGTIKINQCTFIVDLGASAISYELINARSGTVFCGVYNSLLVQYNNGRTDHVQLDINHSSIGCEVLNCTFYDDSTLQVAIRARGTTLLHNNIFAGFATDISEPNVQTASSNNLTTKTTFAWGTSNIVSATLADIFTNLATEDFTLKAASPAIGEGLDLSASFTTDITGATRTTPWDIGAFMWVEVASGVTLTAPADTTTQTQPITFSWEAEAGAVAYQLQIATDSAFTSIVHDDDTLTTTSKSVSGLAAATLHYWRVRADI